MKKSLKFTAVFTVLAMLATLLPAAVFSVSAESGTVKFATISDLHWFDITDETRIDEGFTAKTNGSTEQVVQASGILDSALEAISNDGVDYLLVSGDMTFNGELEGHRSIAARLKKFEDETGIPVIVSNGNHDINNNRAMKYIENPDTGDYYWEYSDSTTPEDFREIYSDLGWDIAYHSYDDGPGWAGSLSYSVNLSDKLRLIVIDGAKATSDNTDSGLNLQETGGNITEDTLEWVLSEIADAKEAGMEVIGMTHWNLSPVNYFQGYVMKGFVMDNWEEVSEILADAGMHYIFTGHSHLNDISSVTSDNGEILYTIETDSLVCFPNQFRENTFTVDNGKITADFKVVDCDRDMQVVDATGRRYSKPYRKASYDLMYGSSDPTAMAMALAGPLVRGVLGDVAEAGLIPYIEGLLGFKLNVYFDELLHGGLVIDNQNVLTAYNVMGLLTDIADQIEMKYVDNPDYTMELLENLIRSLAELPVSTYPCNHWLSEYGLGSNTRPGNLGEAVMSAMLYMYLGNEDPTGDAFLADVLERFESGELVSLIADWAKEYLIKGFVEDEILSSININLSSMFLDEHITKDLAELLLMIETNLDGQSIWERLKATFYAVMEREGHDVSVVSYNIEQIFLNIDKILELFGQAGISDFYYLASSMLTPETLIPLIEGLLGENTIEFPSIDRSILGIANYVLSLGVLEKYGTSVDEVVDYFVNQYVTDYACTGVGYQVKLILGSLIYDEDPQFKGDFDVTYVYDGPVEVIPTKEDYRLPSFVTTSFGADAATEYNISWYTKTSLKDTDIEIYESNRYASAPEFTGVPTLRAVFKIETGSEKLTKQIFGVDLGAIGFLAYSFPLQRHTVNLSGLKANTTYYYRIGNAEKNWWSDTGVINTATTGGNFSFVNITDTQGVTEEQYEAVSDVLAAAFELYPNTAYILHNGDFVEHGASVNQWKWFANAAESYAMKSAIMPVSGNHDALGDYAVADYFNIDVPDEEYDTYNGMFYSFDYDNAHTAVINSNDLCADGTLSTVQYTWLKEDLAASDAEWKFVAIHEAVYSDGQHFAEEKVCALRDQLGRLMPELGVDVVFQGHDHVYFRTDALNNNKIFAYDKDVIMSGNLMTDAMVNPDGTVYVVSGSAGGKSYANAGVFATADYFPAAVTSLSSDSPVFSAVTIDGNKLIFKAYTVTDGYITEIDSFGIEKAPNTVKVGDTNLDGRITAADAREALRAAAGLERIVGMSRCAADVNGDGFVSANDARLILRAAADIYRIEPEIRDYDAEKYDGEYRNPVAPEPETEVDLFH